MIKHNFLSTFVECKNFKYKTFGSDSNPETFCIRHLSDFDSQILFTQLEFLLNNSGISTKKNSRSPLVDTEHLFNYSNIVIMELGSNIYSTCLNNINTFAELHCNLV